MRAHEARTLNTTSSQRDRLILGVGAGALMGLLVGGIGGRFAMRLIALGQGRSPMFTLRGSLTVVGSGTILGVIVGVVYVYVRRFIPGRGVVRGLVYSLMLQLVGLVIGFPLPLRPPSGRFEPGDIVARAILSALLFVAGAALELIVARSTRNPS